MEPSMEPAPSEKERPAITEHDAETTEQEVVTDAPDTENGEYETATDAGASAGRVPGDPAAPEQASALLGPFARAAGEAGMVAR